MFVVKVYCKIATSDLTVNLHHEHFIDPTNCPWVSEDDPDLTLPYAEKPLAVRDLGTSFESALFVKKR